MRLAQSILPKQTLLNLLNVVSNVVECCKHPFELLRTAQMTRGIKPKSHKLLVKDRVSRLARHPRPRQRRQRRSSPQRTPRPLCPNTWCKTVVSPCPHTQERTLRTTRVCVCKSTSILQPEDQPNIITNSLCGDMAADSAAAAPPPSAPSRSQTDLSASTPNSIPKDTALDTPSQWKTHEFAPGVLARDFGFPSSDCRHWGLPARGTSDDGDLSDDSSNLSQYSDEGQSSLLPRLFPDDRESHSSSSARTPGRAAQAAQAAARGYQLLNPLDVTEYVLPHLSKELRPHVGGVNIAFTRIRAMFDFQKETAWEMNVREGEELFIATVSQDQSSPTSSTKPTDAKPTPTIKDDTTKTTTTADTTTNTTVAADGATQAVDSVKVDVTNKSNGETSDNSERWATIDEEAHTHGKKKKKTNGESGTGSGSGSDDATHDHDHGDENESADNNDAGESDKERDISFQIEPMPVDFAAQLNQLLDYQGVYGSGWVTGIKLRIKGRLVNPKTSVESSSGILGLDTPGDGRGTHAKIRIRMYNLGLVPGNYVEKLKN